MTAKIATDITDEAPVKAASPRPTGLSTAEARRRLAADGPNALPHARPRSILAIAVNVLKEPMLALLLIAGFAYLLLGDRTEATILLLFATFSVAVTIMQETRTERVLEALRDMAAPRAQVLRDGTAQRIPGSDVVRGDLLILEAGDRITADADLADGLVEIDESLLTGESLPIAKPTESEPESRQLWSGTLVTRGNATAVVTATGAASQLGRIGSTLAAVMPESPRLRAETGRLVRIAGTAAAICTLAVVLLYGLARGGWIESLLAGIAIGMALLPEEFPVVLTVFMAMGAWRIGRAGVLTRQPSAIETLGATTLLCTDKTGTLTQNRMAVAALWSPDLGLVDFSPGTPLPAAATGLLDLARLASAPVPGDPLEIAFHEAAADVGSIGEERTLCHVHALSPELLAMANVWRIAGDRPRLHIAAKGAPEAIAGLCGLDDAARGAMAGAIAAMAEKGMRVLGLADAESADTQPGADHFAYAYRFAGLAGVADPLRPEARAAVAECRQAGVRVVMITGDHAATARAIADAAGIEAGETLNGTDLETMDDAALATSLARASVFARIRPEQKLRLVEAFKQQGEIVAMIGDGVNDAPSLKAAHIGVAMGQRGSDVAREAAAMVLLKDDFASVGTAIRLGRRIHDNIRKAMAFIIAVHVPIAGLALLPLLLGHPLMFGPIHIALFEMIIDPACALAFEAEPAEPGIMRRPPRPPAEHLLTRRIATAALAEGALALLMLVTLYLVMVDRGMAEADLRALMFFAFIAAIVALILANRARSAAPIIAVTRPNRVLAFILAGIVAFAVLAASMPWVRQVLGFGALSLMEAAVAVGTGLTLLLALEGLKRLTTARAPAT